MSILFEFPLNERIRLLLRIEHVYKRLKHFAAHDEADSHHAALLTLFEFLELANSRSDMKSEVLQELERQRIAVQAYAGNVNASSEAVNELLQTLETRYKNLQNNLARIAQNIREDEWLMAIYARANVAGGTCSFDLPSYHGWMHQAPTQRQAKLNTWIEPMLALVEGVQLVLHLLRESYPAKTITVENGSFQQDMRNKSFQMVRLWIPESLNVLPEISANKYGIWIRLLQLSTVVKPPLVTETASLELAMCAI